MDRTVAAVAEFVQFARDQGAHEVRAATTGVSRKALNTEDFLDRVQRSSGLRPVVIEGEAEAAITALGAVMLTHLDQAPFLLFDIGGFSTEIILVDKGRPLFMTSLELGAVRLTEDHMPDDIPSSSQMETVLKIIADRLERPAKQIEATGLAPKTLVGTAGTVTSLAAMAQNLPTYDSRRVEGRVISRHELTDIADQVCRIDARRRIERYPSLEKGREDVIIAGILICRQMLARFGFDSILTTEGSLLEGLVGVDRFAENPHSH